jgi:hypothetical protein
MTGLLSPFTSHSTAMRRRNAQRIFEAQRTGLRNRLRDERHVSHDKADQLLDGWAAEAAARELTRDDPRYWSEGWAWLVDWTLNSAPTSRHSVVPRPAPAPSRQIVGTSGTRSWALPS